jgi:sterol desaturase/sphingolipid hydroxylase (fatty acid hydroxylase superfamily)
MAEHGNAPFTGPETVEALTADRMRMWSGFTNATLTAIIAVVIVLIGMAVFLL